MGAVVGGVVGTALVPGFGTVVGAAVGGAVCGGGLHHLGHYQKFLYFLLSFFFFLFSFLIVF